MTSVGEKLRRERLKQGLDLAALSSTTRIHVRYLEAIESGNMDELPGGFFYRSFVRQYASALGLDTREVEDELERAREAEAPVLAEALAQPDFPVKPLDPIVAADNERMSSGRIWLYVALLAAVLVGCSAFYAWWRRLETASAARTEQTTVAVAPEVKKTESEHAAPSSALPPQLEPAAPDNAPSLQPVTEVKPSAETPAPAPDDRVVFNLVASEETWLSVSADGKNIFTGLLSPHETKTLFGKSTARIRVGNAGGLSVTWNGKSIGTIGPRGQIRTLVMTPDSYQIIAPAPSTQSGPTGSM